MKLDLKTQRENFIMMDFEEKRNIVASLLEGVKEGNRLFSDLHSLIISDFAIEQDFYDIFDSLMIVLYREGKTEEQSAIEHLGKIKSHLEIQREKEAAEKFNGQKEAEELLVTLI